MSLEPSAVRIAIPLGRFVCRDHEQVQALFRLIDQLNDLPCAESPYWWSHRYWVCWRKNDDPMDIQFDQLVLDIISFGALDRSLNCLANERGSWTCSCPTNNLPRGIAIRTAEGSSDIRKDAPKGWRILNFYRLRNWKKIHVFGSMKSMKLKIVFPEFINLQQS